MNILAIHDGKIGHASQLAGVIEYLPSNTITKILTIPKKNFKFLPICLLQQSFFIPKSFKKEIQALLKAGFLPNKIIAVGKRTLPYSLFLKRLLQQQNQACKIIYLMPPGCTPHKEIDLTFFHEYKKNIATNTMIPIPLAPHTITVAKLQSYRQQEFLDVKLPIIAVLIGGDAKNIRFTKKSAKELIIALQNILQQTKGTLLVSTSRRTSPKVARFLAKALQQLPAIYFNYHENTLKFGTGSLTKKNVLQPHCINFHAHTLQNLGISHNIYLAMLAQANHVIVTGESISMLSECCSLPANVGVYVFFSKHFYAERYAKFHEYLYKNNLAKSLLNFSYTVTRASYNSSKTVANIITKL